MTKIPSCAALNINSHVITANTEASVSLHHVARVLQRQIATLNISHRGRA